MQISARTESFDSLEPVSPITFTPLARATFAASTTLVELPEVEIARRTSPGSP